MWISTFIVDSVYQASYLMMDFHHISTPSKHRIFTIINIHHDRQFISRTNYTSVPSHIVIFQIHIIYDIK